MLKVVTYNIECGLQQELLRKNIRSFANDGVSLFCLQEIRRFKDEPFIGDMFLRDLGSQWKAEYFSDPEYGSIGLALCIMWNSDVLSLASASKQLLPYVGKLKLWEKLFMKSVLGYVERHNWLAYVWKPVYQVFTPEMLKRGFLSCIFNYKNLKIKVISAHLDWAGGLEHRLKQVSFISNSLLSEPNIDLDIVCGDFNTLGALINFKKRSRQVLNSLPQGFSDVLWRPKITAKLLQRLDYIITRGFKQADARVIPVGGSDHKPIIATLEI